jgi:hypothetical protein
MKTATEIQLDRLTIGTRFRLTGDACNPAEAANQHVYTVTNRDLACDLGAHLIVADETGAQTEMRIMPWVPIIILPPPEPAA